MSAPAITAPQRLRAVLDEAKALHLKGVLTGDDATRFDSLVQEAEGLKAQQDTAERLGSITDWASKSAGMLPLAEVKAGDAAVTFAAAGNTTLKSEQTANDRYSIKMMDQYGEGLYSNAALAHMGTNEYRAAFKDYLRNKGNENRIKSGNLKILQEGIDTEGGFAVPLDVLDRVIAKEPTPTRVAGRVTQLQTSRDMMKIPRINYTTDDNYTTGMRVTWTGEIPASSSTANVTDPVFGETNIPIYTAMMKILLTNDMVEDASFPLVSYVSGKFGETIDLLRDNMVENGTGIGQPSGMLLNPGGTNQPAVTNSGQSATLATDGTDLIKLAFALPEQYDMNAAWVFNKTSTGSAIAQLKDAEGRFLWGSGLQDSGLEVDLHNRRLLGYPVLFSGFMPNIGASNYPIVFGDLSGYYLVNRIGFSIQVLREVYAETNQIALVGRIRFGGQVVEPWKLRILRCHT